MPNKYFPTDQSAVALADGDYLLLADVSDSSKAKKITAAGVKTYLDGAYLNVANTTPFTPTADYHPATKKYVDNAVAGENLWDRAGTVLSPHTANDSLNIGSGSLSCGNVSISSSADSSLLNVRSAGIATGGLSLYAGGTNSGYIAVGTDKVTGSWVARATSGILFGSNGVKFSIYDFSGATVGGAPTFVERFYVSGANICASPDTDTVGSVITSRARMGFPTSGASDYAYFGHYDCFGDAASYALAQGAAGNIFLNAKTGQTIAVCIAGVAAINVSSDKEVGIGGVSAGYQLKVSSATKDMAIEDTAAYNASPAATLVFRNTYKADGTTGDFVHIIGGKENANVDDYASYFAIQTRINGGSLTERLRMTSAGYFGLGTSAPSGISHVLTAGTSASHYEYHDSFSDSYHAAEIWRRSSNNTSGAHTATTNGQYIGQIIYQGDSGSAFINGCVISVVQDGSVSTYTPTNYKIETYGAAAINSNQWVLHNDGMIGILNADPDANLDIVSTNTTKDVLQITASSLSSGNGLYIYSNSSDTTGRYLAKIHNDHASAVGAVCLYLRNDAPITSGSCLSIESYATGNSYAAKISNDYMVNGGLLFLKSNSSDANTRSLLEIHNDHASAVGTIGLKITMDAGNAIDVISGTSYLCNTYPKADDTYWLGKYDDDSPAAWKGVCVKDTANGKYYAVVVTNGVVTAVDLTD